MIYEVTPTKDRNAVRAIMLHPRVRPWVEAKDDYEPYFDTRTYLLCKGNGKPLGVVEYEPIEDFDHAITGHYAFLPEAWGHHAFELARRALEWAWSNLKPFSIIGVQDERNRRALAFTRRLGFVERSRYPGHVVFRMDRPRKGLSSLKG